MGEAPHAAAKRAFHAWKAENAGLAVTGVPPEGWAAFYAGWRACVKSLDQPSLFDKTDPRVIPSRKSDPDTSHTAARNIVVKAGTQRAYLLQAFDRARLDGKDGLTDEHAMMWTNGLAHPHSEYSKRCSELREAGLIEPTGETRNGSSGQARMVSRITERGRQWIRDNA